jgi:catechol 2,3-dioxygenase-like lactoylglutathione lyase family enzyme
MKFDHVGLSVANLAAQAAWYGKAFDLRETGRFEVPPLQLLGLFMTNDDSITIELLERQGSQPGLQAATQAEALLTRGYGHICVRVDNVQEVNDKLIALGGRQAMPVGPSPEPGVTFSFVADPEGNLIEIIDRKGSIA